MQIEICCPNCNRKYIVSEKHIGQEVDCTDAVCGLRFTAAVQNMQFDVPSARGIEGVYSHLEKLSISGSVPIPADAEHVNEAADVPPVMSDTPQGDLQAPRGQEPLSDLALDVAEPSRTQLWGIARKVLGEASAHVSSAGVAVTSKAASLGSSGVAKATEVGKQTFVAASSAIDASGAKSAIKATASVVSGKLDEVSGKRLVELLESKLQIQDSYNDVLATRLAEALDRIAILEDRVNSLTSNSSLAPVAVPET